MTTIDVREFLKNMRVKHGVYQKTLASHAGISTNMYSLYERGKRGIGMDKVALLLDFFNCELSITARGMVDVKSKNDNGKRGKNLKK